MNAHHSYLGAALFALAFNMFAIGGARAQDAPAAPDAPAASVSLHVTQDTQMSDVLKMLSDQAGTPLIADKSVFATVGTLTINKTTLLGIFKFLKTQEPGLSWQRVYLTAGQPVPDGDTLYQQMQTLKSVSLTGLVVPGDTGTLSFHKEAAPDASKPVSVPAGMREAYLFTDDRLRAKTAAHRDQQAKSEAAPAPAKKFSDNISNLTSDFSQLSPADQAAVLPALMGNMRQLMMNMDPALRQSVMQQMWQQRRQQQNQQAPGQ